MGAGNVRNEIGSPMNPSHHRRVASTYQHVDELLRRAEAILTGSESQPPFGPTLLDAEPWHRDLLGQGAVRVRQRMAETLERFGIPRLRSSVRAVHSAAVLILAAEIDLEELGGRRLENYGPLAPDEVRAMAAANAEIRAILGDLRERLEPASGEPGEAP
jgi:hypothetical protein